MTYLIVAALLVVMAIPPLSFAADKKLTQTQLNDDPLNLSSGPDADVIETIVKDSDKIFFKELLDVMGNLYNTEDENKSKDGKEKLDKFIKEHPEYSDAYFMRAAYLYNFVGSMQYEDILEDVNKAIKYQPTTIPNSAYKDTAGMYGFRANIYYEMGDIQQAMKDLESAININHHDAINISGTNPTDEPQKRQWGKKDFDEIIRKYPKDYRGYLFRAVYYYNYGILLKGENYYHSVSDFKKTINLNQKSSKAYYLLGEIMDQRLIFGPKSKKEYQDEAVVNLKGLSIWNAHPKECKDIIDAYTNAIKYNNTKKEAYLSRAGLYLSTQKYNLAIKDFTKVIELDPDYGGAYHDRGLAYSKIRSYMNAINDFSKAINAKKKISIKYQAYWNRAKAYADSNQSSEAFSDYTKAIEIHTGEVLILNNLSQFRSIYPEYKYVEDTVLLKKLHGKYYPNMEFAGFSKTLLENKDNWSDTAGYELYENRGNTYLKYGYYWKAIEDYSRASKLWPEYTMDRWKYAYSTSQAKCYIDTKTAEKLNNNIRNFWLKYEYKKQKPKETSYSIEKNGIHCEWKKIRTISKTLYDIKGNVMYSSDSPSEWNTVIPDTIGETLYKGWCSN